MLEKILVTDRIADEAIDILREAGYEVDVKLDLSAEELVAAVPAYHGLIVRGSTKVTAEVINAASNLRIIGRAGVGVDNIDVNAATECGVIVCNAPNSNIISAAEQTIGLMIAAARYTAAADRSMRKHEWHRGDFEGVELYGKTLAIFGLGRVGSLVAERASAFGMNVVAHDPFCSRDRALDLGVTIYDDINEVLPIADFITVHLPKVENTLNMFGPKQYAAMKDGVIIVNNSRDGILDYKSLADFVAAGKIAACGIDVWDSEPCLDSPLHEFDNVVLNPHLSASTKEAQLRAGKQIAEFVIDGLKGSIVPSAVNMAPMPPETIDNVGPYIPVCQLIGSTIVQIKGDIPSRISLLAAGTIAGCNTDILAAGVLEGLMSYKSSTRVTPMKALEVAKRHGIRVTADSSTDAGEFASYVKVVADGMVLACTFTEAGRTPRIVSFLGYRIDIIPSKYALVFEYEDKPGRIGIIGTILGEAGINITTMQIGTKPEEKNALVYMNVEQEVPEEVIEQLRSALDLKNLWNIRL